MLVWGGTIAFSVVEKVVIETRLIKDLADRGYRIEGFRILSVKDLLMLIPFINIIQGIKRMISRKMILRLSEEQLLSDKRFIPFTQQETDIYSSEKTIKNAFKLNSKVQVIPTMFLGYMENGLENEILFTKEKERYIIISIKGAVAGLSRKEQYRKLIKEMNEIEWHSNSNIPEYKKREEVKTEDKENEVCENLAYSNTFDKPKVYVKKMNRNN